MLSGPAKAHPARILLAALVGMTLIYVGGISQLLLLGAGELSVALTQGVYPFLLGDLIKVFMTVLIGWKLRPVTLRFL